MILEEGETGQGQVCILIPPSSLVISADCNNTPHASSITVRVMLIMLYVSCFYMDHYELWETIHRRVCGAPATTAPLTQDTCYGCCAPGLLTVSFEANLI